MFKTALLRQPGLEPGSQEWESCMIPLHYWRTMYLSGETKDMNGSESRPFSTQLHSPKSKVLIKYIL